MDVTQAVEQDQIADSLVAPLEESNVEQAGTEGQETQQEEQLESQQESTEEGDDWFPDEQSKVFPDDVVAKYAQRYHGITQEQIEANPSLKQLLHDKINSDIRIQQLQNQTLAEEPEEVEAQPEPTQQVSYDDMRKDIGNFVRSQIDPQRATQFMQSLSSEKDPVKQATMLAEEATDWALRVVDSRIQQAFGKIDYFLEQQLPGSTRTLAGNMYASQWDQAKGKVGAELPDYGTPEFSQLAQETAAKIPGFDDMVKEAEGSRGYMSAKDATRLYGIMAAVAAGQKPNPQAMKQAVETGKRLSRESQIRKSAGNLGAGKSNQELAAKTSDADFWADGLAEYQKQHGRI